MKFGFLKKQMDLSEASTMAQAAAKNGDLASLKKAYEGNPESINGIGLDGFEFEAPLNRALFYKNHDCAVFLFEKNVKVKFEQLLIAVETTNLFAVQKILAAKLDPNEKPVSENDTRPLLVRSIYAYAQHLEDGNTKLLADCIKCLNLLFEHNLLIDDESGLRVLGTLGYSIGSDNYDLWRPFSDIIMARLQVPKLLDGYFEKHPYSYSNPTDFNMELLAQASKETLLEAIPNCPVKALQFIFEKYDITPQTKTPFIQAKLDWTFIKAAKYGDLDVLKFLELFGQTNEILNAALDNISFVPEDCVQVLTYLLDRGADPDLVIARNVTFKVDGKNEPKSIKMPVLVYTLGDLHAFKLLLQKGGNPDSLDWEETPLLTRAIVYGDRNEQIRELLKLDADPEAMDAKGLKPIYWASIKNNVDAMKMLLAIGVKYDDGASLFRARKGKQEEMIKLLEAYERGEVPSREDVGLGDFWHNRALRMSVNEVTKPEGHAQSRFV